MAGSRKLQDVLGDVSKYEVGRDGRDSIPNSDLISDTGGLRKVRFADRRLGTGKRGGFRVIYYWWGRPKFIPAA